MEIYTAHPVTREYLGKGQADPDPLDEGNWLIPAYAYPDAPPAISAGHAARRTVAGDAWEVVEDRRGAAFEKATGRKITVVELGPLPDALTALEPATPYDVWDGAAWATDSDAVADAAAADAINARDERLRLAAIRIAPLQDAVDLEVASDAEVDQLQKWKVYRVNLNRIEQQPGFPLSVEWPPAPGA